MELNTQINKNVQLLTQNNHKTIKGEKMGIKTLILYLSPHKKNSKGKNLCPNASNGCSKACLFGSGFGGMYENVMNGRINKTEWFLSDRDSFMEKLVSEIELAISKYSNDWVINIRLNGTSDIPFENIKVRGGKNIFELFSDINFYDYTKNWKRFDVSLPANYHLTFSRSETNEDKAMGLLARGYNVAWVFNRLVSDYRGYKVINGDESDNRVGDERGVIVGLKYKNMTGKGGGELNKFAKESGFVTFV